MKYYFYGIDYIRKLDVKLNTLITHYKSMFCSKFKSCVCLIKNSKLYKRIILGKYGQEYILT